MNKVVIEVPAKLNLVLDIVGTENGFHNLKTLVTTINVYDTVSVSARQDEEITVKYTGYNPCCLPCKDNAYRAAAAFIEKYSVGGADIVINKNIPLSGGMGGSSADIVGVVEGMKRLYNVDKDVDALLNELGSDTVYMSRGGYALLGGKGEKVQPVVSDYKFWFLLLPILDERAVKVSSAACYKRYDEMAKTFSPMAERAAALLEKGDAEGLCKALKNDLYPAASDILGELKENLYALRQVGYASMTGSGSTVFSIYKSEEEREKAYNLLNGKLQKQVIRAETVFKNK